MRDLLLFFATLITEFLAMISVVVSITRPGQRLWPPPRPRSWQGYAMWFLFIFSGAGVLAVGILDWGSLDLPAWLRSGVGLPLWVAGNALAVWGLGTLGLASSFGNQGGLIQNGPYRFTRNPQYLGFLISLIGWAIWSSSPLTSLLSLAGCLPLILVPFAEESHLNDRIGENYQAYKRKVPRFISFTRGNNQE